MQNALTLCELHSNIYLSNAKRIEMAVITMTNLMRQARLSSGFTIEEAAEKLNISGGYLSQIENGVRQVSDERAEQIATLYGRSKEDIFLPKRYAVRKVKTA